MKHCLKTNQSQITLTDQVRHWPNPTVCGNYNKKGASKNSGDGLATKVNMWPTPCATAHKGSGKTGTLRDRLDYACERGATKLKTWATLQTQVGSGQLNPDWVEWLMGWPIGWTRLESIKLDWRDWSVDPADTGEVSRVGKGIKNRVNRLKAIGNGQVPACAALSWGVLTNKEETAKT